MVQIPSDRPPVHPGEMLVEEFLKPLGLSQIELARRIGVPFQRVNQIANRRRAITPDTALRFSRLFTTSAAFWLNLQQRWDLYAALHSPRARSIQRIKPVLQKAS